MKIAICFWGLNRSLKYTFNSIKTNIFDILKKNNIEYDIYVHTYNINRLYNNIRASENFCKIDNSSLDLLKPDYLLIDDQDEIDKELNLNEYRKFGCPWNSYNYETLNNLIRSLYSMNKITEKLFYEIDNNNKHYDAIIYSRPDVLYLNNFDINYLNINYNTIKLVDYAKYPVNDRFAICNTEIAKIYGTRYKEALNYSKIKPLHSETFLYDILNKYKIKIEEIHLVFHRVRANGIICYDNVSP
jgi:hypothetical protein